MPGLSFDTLDILIEHLHQLYTKRYGLPRTRIPKSTHWRDFIARFETPIRFKTVFCIDLQTFDTLLDLIIDHPVFQNNSPNPQKPVWIQVMVALCHFGLQQMIDWSFGPLLSLSSMIQIALLTIIIFYSYYLNIRRITR